MSDCDSAACADGYHAYSGGTCTSYSQCLPILSTLDDANEERFNVVCCGTDPFDPAESSCDNGSPGVGIIDEAGTTCTVTCKPGYHSRSTAVESMVYTCPSDNVDPTAPWLFSQQFVCDKNTCVDPTNKDEYNLEYDPGQAGFSIRATGCADGYMKTDPSVEPIAEVCETDGDEYTLQGCSPVTCTRPDTAGYDFTNAVENLDGPTFSVTNISCAQNYSGYPGQVSVCDRSGPYTVTGCFPDGSVCVRPDESTHTGYNFSTITESSLELATFDVFGITCKTGYTGTPRTASCQVNGEPYLLDGCYKETCIRPQGDTANLYDFDSSREIDLHIDGFDVRDVTCVAGYKPVNGTSTSVVASACDFNGGEYNLTPCTRLTCGEDKACPARFNRRNYYSTCSSDNCSSYDDMMLCCSQNQICGSIGPNTCKNTYPGFINNQLTYNESCSSEYCDINDEADKDLCCITGCDEDTFLENGICINCMRVPYSQDTANITCSHRYNSRFIDINSNDNCKGEKVSVRGRTIDSCVDPRQTCGQSNICNRNGYVLDEMNLSGQCGGETCDFSSDGDKCCDFDEGYKTCSTGEVNNECIDGLNCKSGRVRQTINNRERCIPDTLRNFEGCEVGDYDFYRAHTCEVVDAGSDTIRSLDMNSGNDDINWNYRGIISWLGDALNWPEDINECKEICDSNDDCAGFSVHPFGVGGSSVQRRGWPTICKLTERQDFIPTSQITTDSYDCYRKLANRKPADRCIDGIRCRPGFIIDSSTTDTCVVDTQNDFVCSDSTLGRECSGGRAICKGGYYYNSVDKTCLPGNRIDPDTNNLSCERGKVNDVYGNCVLEEIRNNTPTNLLFDYLNELTCKAGYKLMPGYQPVCTLDSSSGNNWTCSRRNTNYNDGELCCDPERVNGEYQCSSRPVCMSPNYEHEGDCIGAETPKTDCNGSWSPCLSNCNDSYYRIVIERSGLGEVCMDDDGNEIRSNDKRSCRGKGSCRLYETNNILCGADLSNRIIEDEENWIWEWNDSKTRDTCDRNYKGDLDNCNKKYSGNNSTRKYCDKYENKCAGNTNPREDVDCYSFDKIPKSNIYELDRKGNGMDSCCDDFDVVQSFKRKNYRSFDEKDKRLREIFNLKKNIDEQSINQLVR